MQTEAPPPPVLVIPAEGETSFADHPIMLVDDKRVIVFALTATASADEIQRALAMLSADGWSTRPGRTSMDKAALTILAKGRTGGDIKRLNEQIAAGKYGRIDVRPFVTPAPETSR